jgi:hypothetical protein
VNLLVVAATANATNSPEEEGDKIDIPTYPWRTPTPRLLVSWTELLLVMGVQLNTQNFVQKNSYI